jgi:hypothetical protein
LNEGAKENLMAHQDVKPDTPSHTKGTHRGEEWGQTHKEPGRKGATATVRSSTSINADKREPIDPRMPFLPPA